MNTQRICGLATTLFAGMSIGGIVSGALPGSLPDVTGGQSYSCYYMECSWTNAPSKCQCPIVGTPADFCKAAIPAAGTNSVPCPLCTTCPRCTCGQDPSQNCGGQVWNCGLSACNPNNPGDPCLDPNDRTKCAQVNCNGSSGRCPPAAGWGQCTKTDKPNACADPMPCANPTGVACQGCT